MKPNSTSGGAAAEDSSPFDTHQQYPLFKKLGSPINFLSRSPSGSEVMIHNHYSKSQTAFAHQTMRSLIALREEFDPAKIFDLSKKGLSRKEVENVETLYRRIVEERIECRANCFETHEKKEISERLLKTPELFIDKEIATEKDNLEHKEMETLDGLIYRPSHNMSPTSTILSNNENYYKLCR